MSAKRQVGRSGLQHVDQVLIEVLANLHDREVRTESRSLGTKQAAGGAELGQCGVRGRVVQEVRARGQRSKAKAHRVEGHALNVQRGLAGLVKGQLEIIAVQQIDAVEGRILRRRRDLRDDVVVLLHQARTNVLGSRIGERFAGGAAGGGDSANVAVPLSATVFAAAVVPAVRIWLALSLVEVKPIDPSAANDAVNPMPAEESAALKASIELTLPAATVLLTVMVVAAPTAGVKTKVGH